MQRIAKFSNSTGERTARGRWPASGLGWQIAICNSFLGGGDVSIVIGTWPRRPKVCVEILRPGGPPPDSGELIASFPRGLSQPAASAAYAWLHAGPPPPPRGSMGGAQVAEEKAPF